MKTLNSVSYTLTLLFSVLLISACTENNSDYSSDITIISKSPSALKAGFAAVPVTPEVPDRWNDLDGNAEYNPGDGDTFTDGNGNGKFDPVWIAGFGNRRAANGVHDDLWARTFVIDDGSTRIAIVSLDVIGFMNNAVNDVRKMLSAEAGITYLIISSTHTHEGPDLLGLWGKRAISSGIDKNYMEFVKREIVKSVEAAVKNLRPAKLEVSENLTGANHLLRDSRTPEVLDPGLRIIKAVDKETGKTLGSLITWGNHPETLWGKNLLITSDFPHYFREGVEKGIGGTVVYLSGAVGGLMTTSPSVSIKDSLTGIEYKDPSFEKAKAQGDQLAALTLECMKQPSEIIDSAAVSVISRRLAIPLDNKLFRVAKIIGVLDRGSSGSKISTEVAVVTIGPVTFATFPGEVYPEIVNGGIESPEGNDFSISPVEVPAIREVMPGKYKFILGLANDEIGYIIPKSQWDTEAPFTYGRTSAPYGEENSMGPETAQLLHGTLLKIFALINQTAVSGKY
jgi:hypothetical protein